ncbi:endonuclease 8-like 1 [Mercenaria mercenaria]|uniref:endonuclease 8-like 1 n=1 Tax=Mercenaria mercenaria TaxID=6596 RepID=UPI00234EDA57|nr:endonuclease 8-like 1 [Mercenaria mercenaria]
MPEGPELHLASRFINNVCKGRLFGKILKSDISKNPVVHPPAERYTITASSRGKEIKVTLKDATNSLTESKDKFLNTQTKSLDILFTFGLAGKFDFQEATELQKHAHLNFFTRDSGPEMVLSFVDYMRFGKWSPGADFSLKERGPCVLFDYINFRNNVFQNLEASAFNKPICEVLLNQKYFNGIGNYLRAEILHRAKIPPFVSARSVLEPLAQNESTVKSETPDILQLCHLLPQEVVTLESSWYDGKDRSDESNSFNAWLQCYYQDGMKNIADHNKRTIWYSGPLGPLAPKEGKVRARKTTKSKKKSAESKEDKDQANKKKTTKRTKKDVAEDNINEDAAPTNSKKSRKTKSASSKVKHASEEKTGNEVLTNEKNGRKERVRAKDKKSVKHKDDNISCNGDLSEALNTSLQTGRLTRGRIKQIVETIENISENKTGGKKKTGIKRENVSIKSEGTGKAKEEDLGVKDGNRETLKKEDSLLSQDIVKTEGQNGVDTEVHETVVLSARTKSRARAGRPLNNGAAYLHSSKITPKEKLKNTRKKSLKRLSTS